MPRTARSIALLALPLLLAGCPSPEEIMQPDAPAEDPQVTDAMREAETVITAETLRRHVAFLADDALEGRGPGTSGEAMAREYLATSMRELELEPAFGDAWEQPFELLGIETHSPEAWTFEGPEGEVTFSPSEQFMANSGVQDETTGLAEAEVVFVGYGITAPEYDWNDYKGQDLSGKVLLMMNNDPDWDPELFAGETRLYYGRWTYKYEEAARQGAAGAIIIHTDASAGYGWNVVQSSWAGPQYEIPADGEAQVPVKAWLTEEAASEVAALAGQSLEELVESARSRDFEPVALGVTTSIELGTTITTTETANVGGLLRGRDAELADEVVVYTAHFDHLGVGEPDETGDRIYNGALDNASGTSSVLAIAEAFAALDEAPRRSVLFLFVAAEEQGLLGSAYYARNPSVPPGRIAANVNIDGANIWGETRDVTMVGHGKSSLDGVVEAFAAIQDRTVGPDQFPDRGYFYRSDQFNFAKIGVPAVYLDTGTDFVGRPEGWGREQIEAWTAEHYHQPSDELTDDWNFDGMVQDTLLQFYVGAWVADDPELPAWNPGDEFEAARREALAAVASR